MKKYISIHLVSAGAQLSEEIQREFIEMHFETTKSNLKEWFKQNAGSFLGVDEAEWQRIVEGFKEFRTNFCKITFGAMKEWFNQNGYLFSVSNSLFQIKFARKLLEASQPWKQELKNRYINFDSEYFSKKQSEETEKWIAETFKLELKVLEMLRQSEQFDPGKAKKLLEALAVLREEADVYLLLELANWETTVACHIGDLDLFFRGVKRMRTCGLDIHLLHDKSKEGISRLIGTSKVLGGGMQIETTHRGFPALDQHAQQENGVALTNSLTLAIIDMLFVQGNIDTSAEFTGWFRKVAREKADAHVKLIPEVTAIRFEFETHATPD